jgi:hypothetical protein
MSLKEYKGHLKDEWEFHKRNPKLFIMWAVYILAFNILFTKI